MELKKKVPTKCPYYPCHSNMDDCSLCYCPFYPCCNETLGKWANDIWDCSNCDIVHKEEVAHIIITSNFAFGRTTNDIKALQDINIQIGKMKICK